MALFINKIIVYNKIKLSVIKNKLRCLNVY
jgi:hypothetical protein